MTDDAELRRLAVRRADMKLGFRTHLMAYAIVNAGLALINILTSPGDWWVQWPMFGWGLGLVAHGAVVYFDGEGVRDRMIEAELEKLRQKR
ncbi:conserved hypothetical protein [Phenylobacterium zucineum HLK1]|uniref:2TM domain-containing protein n=1 Tax=Phenylobacterium zucineum (strain HLK1) TaxID=450851 RepID=B4RBS8_PHEZH|nr:2TM domain-containing protein [Phenylobacterium zucineum]ACG78125.1 conserved hypothetical protein [Phenylobacterium zucineum HLK1]